MIIKNVYFSEFSSKFPLASNSRVALDPSDELWRPNPEPDDVCFRDVGRRPQNGRYIPKNERTWAQLICIYIKTFTIDLL